MKGKDSSSVAPLDTVGLTTPAGAKAFVSASTLKQRSASVTGRQLEALQTGDVDSMRKFVAEEAIDAITSLNEAPTNFHQVCCAACGRYFWLLIVLAGAVRIQLLQCATKTPLLTIAGEQFCTLTRAAFRTGDRPHSSGRGSQCVLNETAVSVSAILLHFRCVAARCVVCMFDRARYGKHHFT